MSFLSGNFEMLLNSESFEKFDLNCLKNLLVRDDLVVPNEIFIWEKISQRRPKQEHPELFPLIRFVQIPGHVLFLKIENCPLATPENKLNGFVVEAYKYQSIPSLSTIKKDIRTNPRKYSEKGRLFWIAEGLSKYSNGATLTSQDLMIDDLKMSIVCHIKSASGIPTIYVNVKSAKFPCTIKWSVNIFSKSVTSEYSILEEEHTKRFEQPKLCGHILMCKEKLWKVLIEDSSMLMLELVVHGYVSER